MKRILILSAFILLLFSCKKQDFAPEGPTDIRIRNQTTMSFTDIVIKTSEYTEDVGNITVVPSAGTSEYIRFKKAYPKAEITLKVNLGGGPVTLTTGTVDYTYMQYLSTMRVTMVLDIIDGELTIVDVITEEELVL